MNEDSYHEHIYESLPAYVLGALTSEERVEVEDHIETCSICTSEYAELAEAGTMLALNVPPREPPAGMKDRLMARVARESEEPVELQQISRIDSIGAWASRTRVRYAMLATAAVVVAAVAASLSVTLTSGGLNERVQALESQVSVEATAVSEIAGTVMDEPVDDSASNSSTLATVSRLAQANQRLQEMNEETVKLLEAAKAPTSRLAFLESSDSSENAGGALVAGYGDASWGTLLIHGLRQPPDGYVYQLWLDSGDETRSVIAFIPDPMGNAMLTLPVPFFSTSAVGGVTIEPRGGSHQPTGAEVLRLSAR